MSFRARMVAFFVIIVVIPMVAVALVLSQLTSESEVGRADSQLAQALRVAKGLHAELREESVDELEQVAQDAALQQAFLEEDRPALSDAAQRVLRSDREITSVVLYDADGSRIAAAGAGGSVAYAVATPTAPDGERIGSIAVSTTTAAEYAEDLARLTGLDARLVRGEGVIATTLEGTDQEEVDATSLDSGAGEFRGAYVTLTDAVGPPVRAGVFQSSSDISESVAEGRLLVGGILLVFFLLALASSVMVVRSLGGQIDRFLGAARAIGRGDFEARVPADGGDEFAALGREFNLMSEQLKENVEELEHRRREREAAIRRVGEAFAAGLDRTGIATLAVRTATDACDAEAGHAVPGELDTAEPTTVGSDDSGLRGALEAAERNAREAPDAPAPVVRDDAHALATALRGGRDAEGRRRTLGYLAIARHGSPFDETEQELFTYLAGQASVSLDNASLHATVQEQAVTDPLTGLSNRRHFDAALDREMGRSRRFGSDVGLVAFDLDGFKEINDLYGHPEGDRVLMEVAHLLRRLTRDVDQVARLGGDEMAILLPQTDLAGARQLAERIRAGIESLSIHPAGAGAPLTVTASFGVAALPETASDEESLVRVADNALYEAKRAGGNRVASAAYAAVSP